MRDPMRWKSAHLQFGAMPGVEPFTGSRSRCLADCWSPHCSKTSILMVRAIEPSSGTVPLDLWCIYYRFLDSFCGSYIERQQAQSESKMSECIEDCDLLSMHC